MFLYACVLFRFHRISFCPDGLLIHIQLWIDFLGDFNISTGFAPSTCRPVFAYVAIECFRVSADRKYLHIHFFKKSLISSLSPLLSKDNTLARALLACHKLIARGYYLARRFKNPFYLSLNRLFCLCFALFHLVL